MEMRGMIEVYVNPRREVEDLSYTVRAKKFGMHLYGYV